MKGDSRLSMKIEKKGHFETYLGNVTDWTVGKEVTLRLPFGSLGNQKTSLRKTDHVEQSFMRKGKETKMPDHHPRRNEQRLVWYLHTRD